MRHVVLILVGACFLLICWKAVAFPSRFQVFSYIAPKAGSLQPLNVALEVQHRLDSIGLGSPFADRYYYTWNISPSVFYDRNFNGGNPKKDLILGQYIFRGPVENMRKSSMALGINGSVRGRFIAPFDALLDLELDEGHFNSLEGVGRRRQRVVYGCIKQRIQSWIYVDACQKTSRDYRRLANSQETSKRLGFTVFTKDLLGEPQEIGIYTSQNKTAGIRQKRVALSTQIKRKNSTVFQYKITTGSKEKSTFLLSKQHNFDMTIPIGSKTVTSSFSYTLRNGGEFFGSARADRTKSFRFTMPYKNLKFSFGFTENESTIEYYADKYPTISLSF